MRILNIHIENFGRLKDCDITFDRGLNAVVRENGWGKTSLAAFIRAMFYGLEGERKRDLKENERLRYQPWNKGHFGGSMKFEAGGKCYIVTRDFGAKDRNEGFRLQDAVTLLDSPDYSDGSEKSCFISTGKHSEERHFSIMPRYSIAVAEVCPETEKARKRVRKT